MVQQAGAAYKLSGHNFILALTTVLDGHGGVKSITYDAPVSPSLTGTMTITLADDSTTTVDVNNGKGITSIAKTSTSGLVDTYTISYNDGTASTFTVSNGAKGDTGDAWYVWIRYAGQRPTSDADIGTVPDDWIGIYSGTASTAPTSYTAYSWFQYKGEKGDQGNPSTITQQSVTYQESASGTVAPSGSWVANIPTVTPGNFLWTRTVLEFNDGTNVTSYSVSRYGIDGTGAVSTVNSQGPDASGNVALTANDIPASDNQSIQAHITDAESDISDINTALSGKQATLVSGTNIKTVNGQSLLGSGNLAAIPTGGAAGKALVKASATNYDVTWGDAGGALWFTNVAISATTGDIATISDSAITANHVLGRIEWTNPSYITTDVTWTTSAGSLVLNGTASSATTANILLVLKNN